MASISTAASSGRRETSIVDRAGRVCCSGRAGTGSTVPWDVAADGSHDPGSVFPGIEIGYTYAPRQFTPERDICLGTVDASGDQTPWYRDRSPWGGPVVPPEYLHVAALQLVRQAAPDVLIFASGGLHTGIDIAKCFALGAELGGMAAPFLRAAVRSMEDTVSFIEDVRTTIQIAMFACGAGDLQQLRQNKLVES